VNKIIKREILKIRWNKEEYLFPILFSLDSIEDVNDFFVFGQYTIYEFLKIISGNKNRKIILFLDGIGRYSHHEKIKKLWDDFCKPLIQQFKHQLKIIVTIRPIPIILENIIGITNYVGIRPFTKKEVDDFLCNEYIDQTVESPFEDLNSNYGFTKKEICKPLFCEMISTGYSNPPPIKMKNDWTQNMRKTWIYLNYMPKIGGKTTIIDKPLLRKLAVIKKLRIHSNFEVQIEYVNKIFGIDVSKNITENMLSFFQPHESLGDYLIAEFYLESLRNGSTNLLNIGKPSTDTIDFLEGLLGLMDSNDDFSMIHPNKNDILNDLLGDVNQKKMSFLNLSIQCLNSLDDEKLMFINENSDVINNFWSYVKMDENHTIRLFWISRWISLFIVFNSREIKNIFCTSITPLIKEKIARMIKYSSSDVPHFLKKFPGIDLSDEDLEGANLEYAELKGAKLFGSNLSYVHLRGSNLKDVDLHDALLLASDMSHANLTRTNFSDADLSHADLTWCTTEKLEINEKNRTKFIRSHMFHTDLEKASFFTGADFSESIIWQTDMVWTFLENSLFDNTILQYVRFNESQLTNSEIKDNIGILNSSMISSHIDYDKHTKPFLFEGRKMSTLNDFVAKIQESAELDRCDAEKYDVLASKIVKEHGIRFASIIIGKTLEIYNSHIGIDDSEIHITGKDKSILVHYSWLSFKNIQRLVSESYGDIRSFVTEYDKLKLILINLNVSDESSLTILITTEINVDQHDVIRWVAENKLKIKNNEELTDPQIRSLLLKRVDDLIEEKDHKKICSSIKQNNNDILDFVHVYSDDGTICAKDDPRTQFEFHPDIIKNAISRWRYRLKYSRKIGNARYAISSYKNRTVISSLIDDKKHILIAVSKQDKNASPILIPKYKKILDNVYSIS